MTSIGVTQSGIEYRKLIAPKSRTVYKLYTAIKQPEAIKVLTDFFHITKGKTHSFKLYDVTDYSIEQSPALLLDNRTARIQKVITAGETVYYQRITKPKKNSVRVYRGGIEITTGFKVDYATGQITFDEDIAEHGILISCNYFQHVRFNTGNISLKMKNNGATEIDNVEIITVIN